MDVTPAAGGSSAGVMVPPGFETVVALDAIYVLRSEARAWMLPLLQRLGVDDAAQGHTLHGGRGGATLHTAAGHDVVVRPFRRGGLPGRLVRDTYWGRDPRPFRELRRMAALRALGAPVVEVLGAAVRWRLFFWYRGWLVTRHVAGARTLWQWVAGGPAPAERVAVLGAVGRAIRNLHDAGARHPDLNLNNILVHSLGGNGMQVLFVDFDEPGGRPNLRVSPADDLVRLRRSARKLDPAGTHLTAADLATIDAAYRRGAA
jgi:3-deoxy-D-manno-octulosonic acid kinase